MVTPSIELPQQELLNLEDGRVRLWLFSHDLLRFRNYSCLKILILIPIRPKIKNEQVLLKSNAFLQFPICYYFLEFDPYMRHFRNQTATIPG